MNIPDCYDPVYQAERRERDWDEYRSRNPTCNLCRCTIPAGTPYRECFAGEVCESCFEELEENIRMNEEF